jgi:peptidoglycan/xylan/chitin deacetylase (PgdA/CDA1 family)
MRHAQPRAAVGRQGPRDALAVTTAGEAYKVSMRTLLDRARASYRRMLATRFGRRIVPIELPRAIISFTFDDVPATAVNTGGAIMRAYGARATYFVSLGLLGSQTEVGNIASASELSRALTDGNELGCHTFDHLDAWQTSTESFMASVARNAEALDRVVPGATFATFAYPKSGATLAVKRRLECRFTCSRGGGQAANVDATDLNLLKAFFIDARTRVDVESLEVLIDHNATRGGWLVFATHDVTDHPSPYGCTPRLLDAVAEHAALSGALLLPLGEACARVVSGRSHEAGTNARRPVRAPARQ